MAGLAAALRRLKRRLAPVRCTVGLAGLLEALRKILSGELLNTTVRQRRNHASVRLTGGHQHPLWNGLTASEPHPGFHALKGADAAARNEAVAHQIIQRNGLGQRQTSMGEISRIGPHGGHQPGNVFEPLLSRRTRGPRQSHDQRQEDWQAAAACRTHDFHRLGGLLNKLTMSDGRLNRKREGGRLPRIATRRRAEVRGASSSPTIGFIR